MQTVRQRPTSKPRAKRFSTRSEAHPYPHRDAVLAGLGATGGAEA
jgi:hypothetical protein